MVKLTIRLQLGLSPSQGPADGHRLAVHCSCWGNLCCCQGVLTSSDPTSYKSGCQSMSIGDLHRILPKIIPNFAWKTAQPKRCVYENTFPSHALKKSCLIFSFFSAGFLQKVEQIPRQGGTVEPLAPAPGKQSNPWCHRLAPAGYWDWHDFGKDKNICCQILSMPIILADMMKSARKDMIWTFELRPV